MSVRFTSHNNLFFSPEHLHGRLEKYVAEIPKLRLLRMRERSGLVRARLAGVRKARAPVLIFLDSHVECATGEFLVDPYSKITLLNV